MTKVLVLYYSSYGHIERMAEEVAAGVRKSGFRLDQKAPVATVEELANYDAIIFGTPTRFGNMAGQMGVAEVMGNSPYGASTIAGGDGSRQPSKLDLDGARYQGKHIAQIASRLR